MVRNIPSQILKVAQSFLMTVLLFFNPDSSLYKQLTEEGPVENYGERRVNLLKSQVIQLERQVG